MDHNEAIRLQAAEKYALGELPVAMREEFEEHYFECAECAHDIKTAAVFVDNAREVLRGETKRVTEPVEVPARGGWFGWLKPVVAVPAFAAMLLFIGYQNTVTIPEAREKAAHGAAAIYGSTFSLHGDVRGVVGDKVTVRANEAFGLDFDFTPRKTFSEYVCELQDESGKSLLRVNVPGSSANQEEHLIVPGGLVHAGKYSLVFTGVSGTQGGEEVQRLTFTIEFLP